MNETYILNTNRNKGRKYPKYYVHVGLLEYGDWEYLYMNNGMKLKMNTKGDMKWGTYTHVQHMLIGHMRSDENNIKNRSMTQ